MGEKLNFGQKVKAILVESIASPTANSNVVYSESGPLVVRSKGNYESRSFVNANFNKATLKGGNFRGADFSGADLSGVDFSGADLTDANFGGAIVNGTIFDNATLEGANTQGVVYTVVPSGLVVGGHGGEGN